MPTKKDKEEKNLKKEETPKTSKKTLTEEEKAAKRKALLEKAKAKKSKEKKEDKPEEQTQKPEEPKTSEKKAVKKTLSEDEKAAKRKALLEKAKLKKAGVLPETPVQKEEEKKEEEAKEPVKEEKKEEAKFETYIISPSDSPSHPHKHKQQAPSKSKQEAPKPAESKPEPVKQEQPKKEEEAPKIEIKQDLKKLQVSTQVTVRELAEKMEIKPADLIKKLIGMGVFATITQRLDPDTAILAAMDYGYDLEMVPLYSDEKVEETEEKEDPAKLKPRPPVITIMGHVDHGKTTLLDALRSSNVVDTEAGQITQHIGAYTVKTEKGYITVLDTPGHEAFTAMRAHGVKVTDIVIIVVSAADGVMPQTVEAINHAKAANVPIIVALNKIDLPTANAQNVKNQLSNYGLIPEDWGGKVPMVEISAKKKLNLDKLLEIVHIQAEIMELKANPDRLGQGIVIEARKDAKKGVLATIICTKGTIKIGDPFIVGTSYGKVRALINDRGQRIESITPAFPAELLGVGTDVPGAGDIFKVVENEREARHISETRRMHKKQEELIHQKNVSLLSLKSQVDQKTLKMLNIVLKADVYGSMQAIKDSLEKLSNPEVAIHVLHSGIGDITESDVMLAKASNAIIFGFHVDAENRIKEEAEKAGVEIRLYSIIYDLLEELKAAMSGMLEPEIVDTVIGKAEIKQIFDLSSGKIAGSIVREGKAVRGAFAKIIRNSQVVADAKISGLKRFKDDVKEVEKGFECGILISGFSDFNVGDEIQIYVKEEKLRRLNV
ncbi:MAG: translation initiation factor IF-2 [Elusimicrobiota bacterium]